MLPAKPNAAWLYSNAWIELKHAPRMMVNHNPLLSPSRSPWINAWCAHVTVVPDSSRIIVLSSGKAKGSSTSTPFGGHTPPITAAVLGYSEALK